ncbi:MAG: BrnA antitoxin family protein [Pseudomonadota bacterium]
MLRPRGRPKSDEARTAISLRLPPKILARWKATGPGWQTRMVEILAKAKL